MLKSAYKPLQPYSGGDQNPFARPQPSLQELFELYWEFLRRQYPLMALVFGTVMLLTAVFLLMATPKYTGTADLIIDSKRIPLFQQQQSIASDQTVVDSAAVDSQVEVLKSENVTLAVIKKLRLTEDPEFVGSTSGVVGAVVGFLDQLVGTTPATEEELIHRAVGQFQKKLTIKRLNTTYVIEISFQSTSPRKASTIANAVADAYVNDGLEAKYQMSRRAGSWLQDRLKELRQQATDADRAVVDFKAKNNIVDTGGRLLSEQQLAELNSGLTSARGLASDTKARMDRISSILAAGKDGAVLDAAATVTDTLHNEVITRLRSQYLDLAAREADWSAKYGINHLAAVNLRAQMHEISRSINDELKRIAETYKSDYEIAKNRVDSVQADLGKLVQQSNSTSQAQIVLRDLDSTAQTYRALADNFLQLFMQSVQQQSFPITESRLITTATPPSQKSYPKPLLVSGIGFVLATILALIAGLVRDLVDRVFRTAFQVESRLGVDCVSILPLLTDRTRITEQFRVVPGRERQFIPTNGLAGEMIRSPFSRYAESIRTIKVAHDIAERQRSGKSIGITSTLPNEGKSTVAASVSIAMATGGQKTILIDCDLRNPSTSHRLTPDAVVGLFEILDGRTTLDEVIWTDPASGLAFLPTVMTSRVPTSSDVLSSKKMRDLFDLLTNRYDNVVVDLPPLAPVVDVRATTLLVDSYLLVIEWGTTSFGVVERSLEQVPEVRDRLLGAVLNKANLNVLSRYEGLQGSYHSNKYNHRYGYVEG